MTFETVRTLGNNESAYSLSDIDSEPFTGLRLKIMSAKEALHIITEEELSIIESLGFEITGNSTQAAKFLNEHFAGFRIGEYLNALDDLLSPLTLVSIRGEFSFHEGPPPMLIIQYYSENNEDDQIGLAFSQAFTRYGNEIIAELDYLRIPVTARKKGVSKMLLNLNLQQYKAMGVSKIKLEAALSNGGLVWAKAFFVATEPEEVKAILTKAENGLPASQFKFVKRVYDNYYNEDPKGKAFPIVKWSQLAGMDQILQGSYWHGELDLNNSDILTKFKNYVA